MFARVQEKEQNQTMCVCVFMYKRELILHHTDIAAGSISRFIGMFCVCVCQALVEKWMFDVIKREEKKIIHCFKRSHTHMIQTIHSLKVYGTYTISRCASSILEKSINVCKLVHKTNFYSVVTMLRAVYAVFWKFNLIHIDSTFSLLLIMDYKLLHGFVFV